jgi:hypothetical protein
MLANKAIKNSFKQAKSKLIENKPFFENLYLLFDYMKFDACHLVVSETNPVEQIIIAIGEKSSIEIDNPDENYQNEHTIIQMLFADDLQTEKEKENKKDNIHLFQFFSRFPLDQKISLQKQLNLNRLLMAMNQIMPIGGFGIVVNQEVYFRYTILTEKRELSYDIIFNALQMIDFFLRKFSPKILNFINGDEIIGDLINDIETGNIADW